MKKSVFIIHGSFGHPFENWFPWLHQNLQAREIPAFVPSMPTPYGQTFQNWSKIMDAYLEIGALNENSVLVTHSSSCVFALKYATNRNQKFSQLITVSGFNDLISGNADFDQINSEFYMKDNELNGAGKLFGVINSIYSKNDPFIPLDLLSNFADSIGAEKLVIDDGGHFNKDSGYLEFKELLGLI